MERRWPTPREALRNIAIPLVMTGAILGSISIWVEYFNLVKGVREAENISLPNSSSEQLDNAISLQKTKAINGVLKRLPIEQSASLILLGTGALIYNARDRQNGNQNQQSSTA